MWLSLTLTLSHLTIWCSGQRALFLLSKAGIVYLPAAHFVSLRPLFPFRQAQFAQVFLLKPLSFCKLSVGLGSTNKSAISLLLLFDSRFFLSSVFSFTSNSLTGTIFCLFLYCQSTMVPRYSFFPGKDATDEVARQGALLLTFAIPCILSPLPLVSIILFFRTGGIPSYLNSLTHRSP